MEQDLAEPRRQRLKPVKKAWPKRLRSKYLIRWLFYLGPLVYRIVRAARALLDSDGG